MSVPGSTDSPRGCDVLLLTDGLANGGAERQFATTAVALADLMRVRVLSLQGGPYSEDLTNSGIPLEVVWRGPHRKTVAILCIWRSILLSRPALVHSWGTRASMIAGPICRLLGIPLVNSTIRSARAPGMPGSPQTRFQFRAASRFASAIVANSAAGLQAYRPPKNARAYVIYNGFDASRLACIPDRSSLHGERATRVVMSARMAPGKDFATLIETARSLASAYGDQAWHFVLVGDGAMRASYMEMARDLVRRDVVEFAAPTREPLDVIAACDVGVLLTDSRLHEEGCSNSLLEYMACGLPAICTDAGGNREVVEHGVSGLILQSSSAVALKSALESLRDDREKTSQMADAARSQVLRRFSIQTLLEATLRVYEAVL